MPSRPRTRLRTQGSHRGNDDRLGATEDTEPVGLVALVGAAVTGCERVPVVADLETAAGRSSSESAAPDSAALTGGGPLAAAASIAGDLARDLRVRQTSCRLEQPRGPSGWDQRKVAPFANKESQGPWNSVFCRFTWSVDRQGNFDVHVHSLPFRVVEGGHAANQGLSSRGSDSEMFVSVSGYRWQTGAIRSGGRCNRSPEPHVVCVLKEAQPYGDAPERFRQR